MFCPNCGREIPDGSKFCPYCGANLKEASKKINRTKEGSTFKTGERTNLITKLVGITGAILIIISALFLSWMSYPLFGSLRILDLYSLARKSGQMGDHEATGAMFMFILLFLLIIISGLIAFFKPKVGGIIGIIGLIFATVLIIGMAHDDGLSAATVIGTGYYIAWIGVILCFFSKPIAKGISRVS